MLLPEKERDMKRLFPTKAHKWLSVSLILCLISAIATAAIQCDFGRVKVEHVTMESISGHRLAGNLYIPSSATKQHPAPAIVVAHGGNNTKEMQDVFNVEYPRHGYITFSIDMYSHGESESLPETEWLDGGRGLYDAARYLTTLPFVDSDQIGLSAHSRGGKGASETVQLDNKADRRIIRNVFLNSSDPIYKDDDGKYTDVYQDRNIAVFSDRLDSFFFTEKGFVGGTYNNKVARRQRPLTQARNYIKTRSAQSFLNFGLDPKEGGTEERGLDRVYSKTYEDGGKGTRQIFSSMQIHGMGTFSISTARDALIFFNRVAPTSLSGDPNNQIWLWTALFALVGFVGIVLFLIYFVLVIVQYGAYKKVIVADEVQLAPIRRGDRSWFWIWQILGIAFSIFVAWSLSMLQVNSFHNGFFRQATPFFYGMWGLLNGIFNIVVFTAWYRTRGRKRNFDLRQTGVVIPRRAVWRTILIGLLGILALVGIIFAADYLFHTKYALWQWNFFYFPADKIPDMLKVLPLFLGFFVVNSLVVNSFNYNTTLGRSKTANTIWMSLLTAAAPAILCLGCYGYFYLTGWNPFFGGNSWTSETIVTMIPAMFSASFVSRKIYEKTKNPYLAGILMGLVMTLHSCLTTETLPM